MSVKDSYLRELQERLGAMPLPRVSPPTRISTRREYEERHSIERRAIQARGVANRWRTGLLWARARGPVWVLKVVGR